jgi:hypothetical protein
MYKERREKMIRVLISIAPRSYRESLAIALQRYRSQAEVRVAPPGLLESEAQLFQPHMVVCNDESYPQLDGIISSRVEIIFIDDLHANISIDGHSKTIRDIGIDDLLKVLDETRDSITSTEPELPRE